MEKGRDKEGKRLRKEDKKKGSNRERKDGERKR